MQVCYNDAEKAKHVRLVSPIFSLAVSPSNISSFITIQDVTHADNPETWVFTLVVAKAGFPDPTLDDAERLRVLKEDCASLAEPWKSSILWIPDGTKVSQNGLGYWVPTPWDNRNGSMTLVGDAAHPMPPHRGQGLNNCIADVAKLMEHLIAVKEGKLTLKEAVDEYEKEMIPRAAQEVMASKGTALAILNFETFMSSPLMKQGLAAGKS
jgi:2-polyprenyl-6-methoxyphenol hydroxylase-like FAD-dependent oxidoreductase